MKKIFLPLMAAAFIHTGMQAQTARVQAIHNCADAAAATVDVYLDDQILIDDFDFMSASPYIDAPAGSTIELSICAPNSVDTVGAIFKKAFTLVDGETYAVVASGGLAETGATAFDLRAYVGQEMATNQGAGEVSLNIIHGAYDAPAVDIYEVQIPAGLLLPDLSFGEDIGGYPSLPALDFDVQVRLTNGLAVAQFDLNATGLADEAVIIMAKGFVDPMNAAGTEPFGLMAILPDGSVIMLPSQNITPARLQVVHNCAATDAAMVDVWLNDTKIIPDFEFRTATPFIDAPAGEVFEVSITAPGATDTVGALYKQPFLLESNNNYNVTANGIIGSGSYTNPEPFSLDAVSGVLEMAPSQDTVYVAVWHGSTDAPTVDVYETTAGLLIDDLMYNDIVGYLALPPANYQLEIRDESGMNTLLTYTADLSGLGGVPVMVYASGFLDPSMNNNGENFGLWASIPTGGALIELPLVTSVEEFNVFGENAIFPNPAKDMLNIAVDGTELTNAEVRVISIDGRVVEQFNVQAGIPYTYQLNVEGYNAGMYLIQVVNAGEVVGLENFIVQ